MRCAPSVIYPVGRSSFLARLLIGLGLSSVLLLTLWGWYATAFGRWEWWVVALAWVLWAGWAQTAWHRIPRHATLEWDALETSVQKDNKPGRWFWCLGEPGGGTSVAQVHVVADWQSGMLLRLADSKGRSTWVWAERTAHVDRWPDFRRAITFSSSA